MSGRVGGEDGRPSPLSRLVLGLVVASAIAVVISRCERHSAKHFSGFRRAKRHEVANSIVATTVASLGSVVALRTSVTFTSLSGSAPLSPFALIVEVIA